MIPPGLICRNKRVEVAEFGPGDRDHLRGGIQLHGAGSERDHRMGQAEITVLQSLQIAEHLVLGVKGVEYSVLQVAAATFETLRQEIGRASCSDRVNYS